MKYELSNKPIASIYQNPGSSAYSADVEILVDGMDTQGFNSPRITIHATDPIELREIHKWLYERLSI
jgi:hypothetical protein